MEMCRRRLFRSERKLCSLRYFSYNVKPDTVRSFMVAAASAVGGFNGEGLNFVVGGFGTSGC